MNNNKIKVSISLSVASLALLVIYGADETTESIKKSNAHAAENNEANESPEQRAAEQKAAQQTGEMGKSATIGNNTKTSSESKSAEAGEKHEERRGFLPLSEAVRGSVFGGGAIAMSIISFVISRKEYSPIISALLLTNGGVLISIIMTEIFNGTSSSELTERGSSSNEFVIIGSFIVIGAIVLIGIGILKLITDKKMVKKYR